MAFSSHAGSIGAASRPVLTRPVLRAVTAVRATEEEKDSTFFESNKLSKRGYLEQDSAGQENIFAVQPKRYIQGSEVDDTTGSAGNTFFGVAGAALALAVIATGVTALIVQTEKSGVSTAEQDFSGLSTLSEYKSKFVADARPEPVESPPVSSDA